MLRVADRANKCRSKECTLSAHSPFSTRLSRHSLPPSTDRLRSTEVDGTAAASGGRSRRRRAAKSEQCDTVEAARPRAAWGWGQQPSFRPAKGAYIGNTRKRLDVHASLKLVSRFLPVILQQTNKSSTANVVLTKNCMTALREYIEKERPYLIATTPVPTVSEVDISLSRVNGALGLSFDLRNRVLQVTEGQAEHLKLSYMSF